MIISLTAGWPDAPQDALSELVRALPALPAAAADEAHAALALDLLQRARRAPRRHAHARARALIPIRTLLGAQVQPVLAAQSARFGGAPSGAFLYPPGGFMGWHHNGDHPGERVYLVWNERPGSRFLSWRGGRLHEDPEPRGWALRRFCIPAPPRRLWHAIHAMGRRISLGVSVGDLSS